MNFKWEEDFTIRVSSENHTVLLSANKAGLKSLANYLLTLAEEKPGCHFHLDDRNSLKEGSDELIIEKTE